MKKTYRKISILGVVLALFAFSGCSSSTGSDGKEVDPNVADNNKTATNPGAANPEPKFQFEHTDW
ncbi:MAG: hypothetical protein JJ975_13070, partial [Bacteroidia bacterium]|nr:hypothetical protein [Bacteroidia bacterium]